MNSSYGKTIEKPTETEIRIIKNEDYDRFFQKNWNKIIEAIDMDNNFKLIKLRRAIDDHFNFSLLGIQVLSMSKRIMNEVMCLAYGIGCHVYYQDTDSIHIDCADLPKLEESFKLKYKRELRGKNLE